MDPKHSRPEANDGAATEQSSGYGQGRSAPPLRDGALVESQVAAGLPVGVLLRQPTVRDADGSVCRLDELLGPGFALIGRKQGDLRVGPEANGVLARLDARRVSLEGLETVAVELDHLFDTHPALILRPDRYVFGVVDDRWDLDALLRELGRKLALRA